MEKSVIEELLKLLDYATHIEEDDEVVDSWCYANEFTAIFEDVSEKEIVDLALENGYDCYKVEYSGEETEPVDIICAPGLDIGVVREFLEPQTDEEITITKIEKEELTESLNSSQKDLVNLIKEEIESNPSSYEDWQENYDSIEDLIFRLYMEVIDTNKINLSQNIINKCCKDPDNIAFEEDLDIFDELVNDDVIEEVSLLLPKTEDTNLGEGKKKKKRKQRKETFFLPYWQPVGPLFPPKPKPDPEHEPVEPEPAGEISDAGSAEGSGDAGGGEGAAAVAESVEKNNKSVPWIVQQGENGEPTFIGFAEDNDKALDLLLDLDWNVTENTYIDEMSEDTFEYMKQYNELDDSDIEELSKFFYDKEENIGEDILEEGRKKVTEWEVPGSCLRYDPYEHTLEENKDFVYKYVRVLNEPGDGLILPQSQWYRGRGNKEDYINAILSFQDDIKYLLSGEVTEINPDEMYQFVIEDGGLIYQPTAGTNLGEDVEKELKIKNNENIIEDEKELNPPIDTAYFPNNMGINLVSVKSEKWIEQDDGQLKKIEIEFDPATEAEKKEQGQIEEDVEKHDHLNPVLFDSDNKLLPEVKEKLLEIVKDFVDGLEEDEIKFNIKDIKIVGSNASYNYNPDSDIDLHIEVSEDGLECPDDLYPIVYNAYRSLWNKNNNPTIKGIPVELFVETESTPEASADSENSEVLTEDEETVETSFGTMTAGMGAGAGVGSAIGKSNGIIPALVGAGIGAISGLVVGLLLSLVKHIKTKKAKKEKKIQDEKVNTLLKEIEVQIGEKQTEKVVDNVNKELDVNLDLNEAEAQPDHLDEPLPIFDAELTSVLTEAKRYAPLRSNGVYSVLEDKWIKEPVAQDIPELDKEAFDELLSEWESRYFDIMVDREVLKEARYKLNQETGRMELQFADNDICVYLFPEEMSDEDFDELEKYNLEYIGPNSFNGELSEVVKGKYKDIHRYADEYIGGYELHPDYLYLEKDFEINPPSDENLGEDLTSEEEQKVEDIENFINDIYELRQESIAQDGEYGLGNLVFKEIRAKGYLDNLREYKAELKDKKLSIQ